MKPNVGGRGPGLAACICVPPGVSPQLLEKSTTANTARLAKGAAMVGIANALLSSRKTCVRFVLKGRQNK